MRLFIATIVCLALTLGLASGAMAVFPSGSQGDQYVVLNAALDAAAADAGISPETFINIYDTAATGGDLSAFTAAQLAAACQVLSSLASFRSQLTDYDTVFNRLGCGTVLTAEVAGTRGSLPKTGVAAVLLLGLGAGAAGISLYMKRRAYNSQ